MLFDAWECKYSKKREEGKNFILLTKICILVFKFLVIRLIIKSILLYFMLANNFRIVKI